MRIALIADVHANVLALEAVLRQIKTFDPDQIISLGDQVNLGPSPRETLSLLNQYDVFCLHGNHERYILSAMDDDPEFSGANFDSLRFQAVQLTPEEITFPKKLELLGYTFCHAMPDDDRFPINEPHLALPKLHALKLENPLRIVCGHGHNPTHYRLPNLQIDSIGSVGCMDRGIAGTAPFAILDITEYGSSLRPFLAPYRSTPLFDLFKQSGMSLFCPIMARLCCMQMIYNQDFLVQFMPIAHHIAQEKKEAHISHESWTRADELFVWPDGLSTADFWKQVSIS